MVLTGEVTDGQKDNLHYIQLNQIFGVNYKMILTENMNVENQVLTEDILRIQNINLVQIVMV